jgi:hypothetical protein
VLHCTGAAVVYLGWQASQVCLLNPKLQAKLLRARLLSANALVLQQRLFPILKRSRPLSRGGRRDGSTVALSVSRSNSLWFFCAFLGTARL